MTRQQRRRRRPPLLRCWPRRPARGRVRPARGRITVEHATGRVGEWAEDEAAPPGCTYVRSPAQGLVLAAADAAACGERVSDGATVLVLSSMKMEVTVPAPAVGRCLRCSCGQAPTSSPGGRRYPTPRERRRRRRGLVVLVCGSGEKRRPRRAPSRGPGTCARAPSADDRRRPAGGRRQVSAARRDARREGPTHRPSECGGDRRPR